MKLWTAFYDHLLPDLTGCAPAIASIALRRSAREFCEKTLAWDEQRGPVTTLAATLNYPFTIDTTAEEVVKLLGATVSGLDVQVCSVNDLPVNWPTYPGVEGAIFTQTRRTFNLVPARAAGLLVITRVALKPSITATGVTDEIFAHYVEDICVGAKAILMMSMKKPYTDMKLGAMHRTDFEERIATIKNKVARSFSRTPRRVKPMFF